MLTSQIVAALDQMSTVPSEGEEFERWLRLKDATAFLQANAAASEVVVYAALANTFMHAIAVPRRLVMPPNADDLLSWSFNASSSWGVMQSFSPPRTWISPPLDHTGSDTLNQGEQLVFARFFEGFRDEERSYFEILQRFLHVTELHFVPERKAYCRLDRHGELEELIRVVEIPTRGRRWGGTVVTFERKILDPYLALNDSVLVRTFDFTRFSPENSMPPVGGDPQITIEGELIYRSAHAPGSTSYMRGCQIIRLDQDPDILLKRFTGDIAEALEYASFIAHDWKNAVTKEISCAPEATANYFTESDLPYETSPAFFRPEVLLKYKNDSEKYRLDHGSITCRGAWHLQSFDINEAGQVHTYLCDLQNLPYEEQLYWKSYNETPKATISERAFKRDF